MNTKNCFSPARRVVGAWTSIKNGVVYFEPVQSQRGVYFDFLLVSLVVLIQKHDLNSYSMVYDRPCKISVASAVYQGQTLSMYPYSCLDLD